MNKYTGQKKISLPEDPNMNHGSYLDEISKSKAMKDIHGSYLDGLVKQVQKSKNKNNSSSNLKKP